MLRWVGITPTLAAQYTELSCERLTVLEAKASVP